ncbi:MAG: hypothetical protein IKN71_08785 [Alphaproteobacteria bacterium]|nr:hypothetical protein [Alphaproteobacteria bacterium]
MVDIKWIARVLALYAGADMRETARILKEEYGIEAAVVDDKKINDVAEHSNSLEIAKTRVVGEQKSLFQSERNKPYVPRKIGKPRGFPKNMRRK